MTRPGRLITLSGIDCAGKTTQLTLLKRTLGERNEQVALMWFRPGYSPELDALRRWVRRLKPSLLPTTGADPKRRQQLFDRASVRTSWLYLALLDTLLQYGVKLRVSLLLADTVICDRYLPDAALDLTLRFPERARLTRRCLSALKWLCPSPDRAILLNLPEQEMLRRMAEKREPFPDAPELRARRYREYQELSKTESWVVVDATQPPEVVHARILELLERDPKRAWDTGEATNEVSKEAPHGRTSPGAPAPSP